MLNIEVDIQKANSDVDKLGTRILGLADDSKKAGEAIRKNLSFGGSALDEIRALRKEFSSWQRDMKAFSEIASGAKGIINELAGSSLRVVNTMQKATAAHRAQAQALKEQATNTAKAKNELEALARAAKEEADLTQRAAQIKAQVVTAQEKYNAVIAANEKVLKAGKISQDEFNRSVEFAKKILTTTGTEVEIYTARLRKQQAEFGKTTQQLLAQKAGWDTLSDAQKRAAQESVALSQSMNNVKSLFESTAGPVSRFKSQMADLTRLKQSYVQTNGQVGISEKQYRDAVEQARRSLNGALADFEKLRVSRSKEAQEAKLARDALLQYTRSLEQAGAEVGKTEQQLLRMSSGWSQLSAAEKIAAESARRFAADMRTVAPLIQTQLSPLQQYRQQLEALARAQAEFSRSGGTRGINGAQYGAGIAEANRHLAENVRRQMDASSAARALSSNFSIANQSAAAFRATLMGANLGFGIFTSSTIVAATGAYAVSKALSASLTMGAEFERTFERAAVVMGEFGKSSDGTLGKLTDRAELVKKKVIELAQTTQYGTVEVAKAAEVLAQAGLAPIEIYNALAPTLNLAAIGMIDVSEAADMAIGVMYGFGKQASDLDHIVDVMSKTVVATNLNIAQVSKTMTYAAPIAHQMGMTVEETAAAFSVLANSNIKASMAGTTMRRILVQTAAETPKATKAFQELGINVEKYFEQGKLNLRGLFAELERKGASVGQMKDIFGQWAISAAIALKSAADAGSGNTRSWQQYLDILNKSKGAADEMAAGMRMNLTMALENLKSALEAIGTSAFDKFGGGIEQQIRRLTDYINKNADAISNTLTTIMNGITATSAFLVKHGETIARVIVAYTSFKIAQNVISGLVGVIGLLVAAGARTIAQREIEIAQTGRATAATTLYTRSLAQAVIGQAALARGATVAATATAATAAATAASATRLGAFVGITSRAVGFLTGWGGIILTLASVLLPLLGDSLFSVEKKVYSFNGALDEFKIAMEEVSQGLSGLAVMSERNLGGMGDRMKKDLGVARQQVEDLRASIVGLNNQIDSARLSQRIGPAGGDRGDFSLQRAYESEQRAQELLKKKREELTAATVKLREHEQALAALMGQQASYSAVAQGATAELAKTIDGLSQTVLDAAGALGVFAVAMGKGGEFKAGAQNLATYLKNLSAGIAQRVKDRDAARAQTEAEVELDNQRKKSASTLENIIKEYEKKNGSVAELNRQLRDLSTVQKFVSSGTEEATKKLRELGYSADEAKQAIAWKREDFITDYVADTLTTLDSRFKDLKKSADATTSGTLSASQALQIATDALAKMDGVTKAEADALIARLKPALEGIASGAAKAAQEFETLRAKVATDWTAAMDPGDLDSLISRYSSLTGYTRDQVEATLAQSRALTIFSSSMQQARTESDQLGEAQRVLAILVKNGALTADKASRIYRNFAEALPTGALEKENQHLTNQIALMGQGSRALELYNAAWEATGGHLENVSEAFLVAKARNIELQETLKQIQEVQEVYKNFGDGLARMFTDVFTGGIKSFKDFGSRLKGLFKQLLSDLLYMAIRNSIMKAMFNTGSGNTGGFWSSIAQGFMGMFGGGGGGGGGGSASGGGFWSSVGNWFGNFFGGGASSGAGSAGGGGMNWGSLVSGAVQTYSGGGGGAGAGMFSGNTWMSMLSNSGGFNPMQLAQNYFFGNAMAGGVNGATFGSMFPGAATWGTANAPVASLYGGGYMPSTGGLGLVPDYASGTVAYSPQIGAGVSPAGATGSIVGGIAGGIYGLYAGSQAGSGGLSTGLSTVTYGMGAATIGAAAGSIIATGSLAGAGTAIGTAAGAAGLSAGAAAAIPVIGWIAAAIMLIDMFSGGKLFGTKFRPESVKQTIGVGADGGIAELQRTDVRNRSLFRGRQWRTVDMEVPPEMAEGAVKLYEAVEKTMKMTANELETTIPEMIDATFTTVTKYDKKGKATGETTSATINGHTYEGIDFEEFQKRVHAEAMIAVVQKSVQEIVSEAVGEDGSFGAEVDKLADRWRDNADTLVSGAALLVAAQNDIVDGVGLLGEVGPGVLTRTVDIVEDYQASNEGLVDTYLRIKNTVATVEQTLGSFGIAAGTTREEFVRFSMDLVDSLGGLDKAREKLTAFAQAFGEIGQNASGAMQARNRRAGLLEQIGLDPDTTADEFRGLFRNAVGGLSADELAGWIEAGSAIAQVSNALEQMRMQAEGIQGESIADQVQRQIDAIAQLGASEEELAQAREYGNQIIQKALGDFMFGIEGELAKFEGRTHVYQLEQIRRAMQENVARARQLGASLQQLARIQQLAAYQTQQVISDLRTSVTELVTKLYGPEQINEASNAASNYYEQQSDQQQALHEAEMERYRAAQDAIKRITEFLDDIETGDLSTGDWRDRLSAADSQFRDLLQRAMAGDPEAMSQITDAAQTYLDLAREYFGSTTDYADIYNFVRDALSTLRGTLGQVPNPGESGSGGGGSGSGGGSSTATGQTEEQRRAERFQLALQLAQQIGELGLALDVSVFDLLDEFGVDIEMLATDLGIDVDNLTSEMVTNLGMMAGALGISVTDLIDALGITGAQLADAFGIKLDEYSVANLELITDLAETLGITVFDAISLIGIDMQAMALSFGIDINNLGAETAAHLVELANVLDVSVRDLMDSLGIDLSDLATSFGINITDLSGDMFSHFVEFANLIGTDILTLAQELGADLSQVATGIVNSINAGLDTLPDIPSNIRDGLAPFLDAIRDADTTEAINQAVRDLIGYTMNLPEDQREQLMDLFENVGLDVTSGTTGINLTLQEFQSRSVTAQEDIADNTDNIADNTDPIHDIRDGIDATHPKLDYIGSAIDSVREAIENQSWLGGGNNNNSTSSAVGGNENLVAAMAAAMNTTAESLLMFPSEMAALFAAPYQEGSTQAYYAAQADASQENVNAAIEANFETAKRVDDLAERIEELTSVVETRLSESVEKQDEAVTELKQIRKSSKKQTTNPTKTTKR